LGLLWDCSQAVLGRAVVRPEKGVRDGRPHSRRKKSPVVVYKSFLRARVSRTHLLRALMRRKYVVLLQLILCYLIFMVLILFLILDEYAMCNDLPDASCARAKCGLPLVKKQSCGQCE